MAKQPEWFDLNLRLMKSIICASALFALVFSTLGRAEGDKGHTPTDPKNSSPSTLTEAHADVSFSDKSKMFVELPQADEATSGYRIYGDKESRYGQPHVVSAILTVASRMQAKGITIGVGNLSARDGSGVMPKSCGRVIS